MPTRNESYEYPWLCNGGFVDGWVRAMDERYQRAITNDDSVGDQVRGAIGLGGPKFALLLTQGERIEFSPRIRPPSDTEAIDIQER